jgi:hypothetical protein
MATEWRARLRRALHAQWRQLVVFQVSARRWPLPIAAALATGLPLLAGAALGRIDAGLAGSLGGLVFLYLPETSLPHRMTRVVACAFAMTASYAAGLGVQALDMPALRAPLLALVALFVTLPARYYRLPPPGPLFFVMAAAIGAYTSLPPEQLPTQLALLALGVLSAVLIAWAYSLAMLSRWAAAPMPERPKAKFDYVVSDAVVLAAAVGTALLLAEVLGLPRPYWVAVSCMAVAQGTTMHAVLNRQRQRIAGTVLGLVVAGALLSLPLDPWRIAFAVMALTWIVEWLVVRHYGLAVVFITPLTILLAEAATLDQQSAVGALVRARLIDTVLGCFVGLLAGVVLHSPRLRAAVARPLRGLVPRRFWS